MGRAAVAQRGQALSAAWAQAEPEAARSGSASVATSPAGSTSAAGRERSVHADAGRPVSAASPPGRKRRPTTRPHPRTSTSKRRVHTPVTATVSPGGIPARGWLPSSTVREHVGCGSTSLPYQRPSGRSHRSDQRFSTQGPADGPADSARGSTWRANSSGRNRPAVDAVAGAVAFVLSGTDPA